MPDTPKQQKYTESIHVKLTKSQLAACRTMAARIGVGMGDFVRMAVLARIAAEDGR